MSKDDQRSSNRGGRVGYRCPPVTHQFKPGQSGNPLGRPRNAAAASTTSLVDSAYLDEAKRMMRVKDDEGIHVLPAIRVGVRRQSMAAANGDLKAQKYFAASAREAERAEFARREKLFEATIEYKALCESMRERDERYRLPATDFEIDPDHLITDAETRSVRLSVAADVVAAATSREFEVFRKQLIEEREALVSVLACEPDNAVLQSDLRFVEALLQRFGSMKSWPK